MFKPLVIIPYYNEKEAIGSLLEEFLEFKDNLINIVVIDNCSTDKTAEIVSKYPLNLLNLPVNYDLGGEEQNTLKFAFENDFNLAILDLLIIYLYPKTNKLVMSKLACHPPVYTKYFIGSITKNMAKWKVNFIQPSLAIKPSLYLIDRPPFLE